jgi:hypothetical protein
VRAGLVHDLCAAHDYGTDLLAVDDLGSGRPGVADQAGDLLDRDDVRPCEGAQLLSSVRAPVSSETTM